MDFGRRRTGSVALPTRRILDGLASRSSGITTFGCHCEVENGIKEDTYIIKPWDGVGRRIIVRQVGVEVEAFGVKIEELRFGSRKRHVLLTLRNHADKEIAATLRVRGLWGSTFIVAGEEVFAEDGELGIGMRAKADSRTVIEIKVKE
jgi:hypothetical protein